MREQSYEPCESMKGTGEPPPHLAPLLRALEADPALVEHYRRLLKPLHDYDQASGGDLVKTLDAYLRHGGNATQTADALYLHRNSVRYRLARIQALLGLDIAASDNRFALQVALLLARRSA